jgi:hypothetical protein
MNESGCDPNVLDSRLSRLKDIQNADVTARGVSLAIASPTATTANERYNRCVGIGASRVGCRQFMLDLDTRAYLVTAGGVATDAPPSTAECPRDANIRLSVTISGTVYQRRVTLVNLCTTTSCGQFSGSLQLSASFNTDANVSSQPLTQACAPLGSMYWGNPVVNPVADPSNIYVNVEDLRFARRYLSTGGGDVGDTTYINASVTVGNGACAAGLGAPVMCITRACIPALDLNLDRTNNEADLAILEYYLRGFIPYLPVRDFLN